MFRKKNLRGSLIIPGDKSISHRSIILSSIGNGRVEIQNLLISDDVLRTVKCFKDLGVKMDLNEENKTAVVDGVGLHGLRKPSKDLYCGNSGTTMRLLAGLLAGQSFETTLTGDESLEKRPMKRIIDPIEQMGGIIESKDYKAPLKIKPSNKLKGIDYVMPVDSAQIKSAIYLLGLYAEGKTRVIENHPSRNHTEIMMDYFKDQNFKPSKITIPGDISSASFLIGGALILEGSDVLIKDVGINETRSGIIDVFKSMGGNIEISNERTLNGELVGDIRVTSSRLKNIQIDGEIMPRLIDEIPILAVVSLFAEGELVVTGGEELRVKETDRIKVLVEELEKVGAKIVERKDGFTLTGKSKLHPASMDSKGDHRMAMAFSILGLALGEGFEVIDDECVAISYPEFFEDILNRL